LCNETSQETQNVFDEGQCIASAQEGDAQAFAELVEHYEKPVFNLCYRMLGDPYLAEDAAQESFLRAYKAIRRYDPNRKFSTWLLSIAANYCIDQHRRRRAVTVPMDAVAPGELSSKIDGVESSVLQREGQANIQKLLLGLDAPDRAAIVLHYWHGYSYEEIAVQLSITESALKSRMHRARRALAAAMESTPSAPRVAERRQHESAAF
jgi:RNA polymerase sigma-70 factor (ECF subfamily)